MSIDKEDYCVKVSLPGKDVEANINDELTDYSIDEPFEIAEAMKKQASRYFKWADLFNKAKRIVSTLERDYDVWYAKAQKKVREVLVRKEGNNKPTINDLKNGVTIYFAKSKAIWDSKIDKAQDNVSTLDTVVRATSVKKDMLVSVGQLVSRLIDSGNLVVKDKKISKRRD